MRAVLDTNVLVSGFSTPLGVPGEILERWLGREFTLVSSASILDELEDVLNREYFANRFSVAIRRANLDLVRTNCDLVLVTGPIPHVVSDPADNVVLESAVQGSAAYLVTGDRLLLRLDAYQEIKIVSPRHFLTILESI